MISVDVYACRSFCQKFNPLPENKVEYFPIIDIDVLKLYNIIYLVIAINC